MIRETVERPAGRSMLIRYAAQNAVGTVELHEDATAAVSRHLVHLRRGPAVVLAVSALLLAAVWPLSFIRGFELTRRTIDGYLGKQLNVVEARDALA